MVGATTISIDPFLDSLNLVNPIVATIIPSTTATICTMMTGVVPVAKAAPVNVTIINNKISITVR